MFINGIEFKKYDDCYYVSANGDVYSTHKKGLLKHDIDLDGYHRVGIHNRHVKIHRLVYTTWIGPIPDGMQINHRDDDKEHNHYTNLYAGSQKQNIQDCIRNGTRKGHMKPITVYDNVVQKELTFNSVLELIEYTGHPVANGSLVKLRSRKWFQTRCKIVNY